MVASPIPTARIAGRRRTPGACYLPLLCLLTLSGCAFRNTAELFLLGRDPNETTDLPYGQNPRQRLDIYRPRGEHRRAPVVVFLHGGRWQHGSRREYRLLGAALGKAGVVAVIPDYRLYPEVRFPAWVEDAAQALRWVYDNIGLFGGDPLRIFVAGHSSGAHSAALLALDEHFLSDRGLPSKTVRGFIIMAGPVATFWTDPDVQQLMGPPEGWRASYPVEQVHGAGSPMLLLHGGRDELVSPANSTRLADRVRDAGGCVGLRIYRGLGHVGLIVAMSLPQLDLAPVLDEVIRFVQHPTAVCEGEV